MENAGFLRAEKSRTRVRSKRAEIRREQFRLNGGYTKINDLLCYGVDAAEHDLHIHITPARDILLSEKLQLLKEGLKDLAQIVDQDPRIQQISATSWIVKRKPKLLKRLGFTVDNSLATRLSLGAKSLATVSRPLGCAFISREKFLDRYLK